MGCNHYYYYVLFLFFQIGSLSLAPAGVQWHDPGSLTAHCSLNLLSASSPLTSAFQDTGATEIHHHAQLLFIFCRDEVSLCCPGWFQTPRLRWSTSLCLPKCWDYRRQPPCTAHTDTSDSNETLQDSFSLPLFTFVTLSFNSETWLPLPAIYVLIQSYILKIWLVHLLLFFSTLVPTPLPPGHPCWFYFSFCCYVKY